MKYNVICAVFDGCILTRICTIDCVEIGIQTFFFFVVVQLVLASRKEAVTCKQFCETFAIIFQSCRLPTALEPSRVGDRSNKKLSYRLETGRQQCISL